MWARGRSCQGRELLERELLGRELLGRETCGPWHDRRQIACSPKDYIHLLPEAVERLVGIRTTSGALRRWLHKLCSHPLNSLIS